MVQANFAALLQGLDGGLCRRPGQRKVFLLNESRLLGLGKESSRPLAPFDDQGGKWEWILQAMPCIYDPKQSFRNPEIVIPLSSRRAQSIILQSPGLRPLVSVPILRNFIGPDDRYVLFTLFLAVGFCDTDIAHHEIFVDSLGLLHRSICWHSRVLLCEWQLPAQGQVGYDRMIANCRRPNATPVTPTRSRRGTTVLPSPRATTLPWQRYALWTPISTGTAI